MQPKKETLIPLLATSVAVVATFHVIHPALRKLASRVSLQWKLAKREKDGTSSNGAVSSLFIHPVKSLRAVSVQEAELDAKGFVGDRRLMIVYPAPLPAWKDKFDPSDTTHRFLTQRQCPSLARVVATLGKNSLTLQYQKTTIQVALEPQEAPKQSYRAGIWDDQVTVDDLGDTAAAFFQTIVNFDKDAAAAGGRYGKVRLVIHSVTDRRADPKFTPPAAISWLGASPPPVSLTDGFPILIACQASLDELNRRLEKNGKSAIEMSRFRANIVITGTTAFEEDRWKYIAIGDQLFAIVKACPRCKQSCTDQETGKVNAEPVETMKDFRALNDDNKEDVFFAQNAIPLGKSGTVQVGDSVHVLERGDPVYC
jgi:uncharacterized protein YcbX